MAAAKDGNAVRISEEAETVHGKAYQDGDHWFIPCTIRNRNGSREESTAMIKFYRFGDQERCIVIGTKENGIYD